MIRNTNGFYDVYFGPVAPEGQENRPSPTRPGTCCSNSTVPWNPGLKKHGNPENRSWLNNHPINSELKSPPAPAAGLFLTRSEYSIKCVL